MVPPMVTLPVKVAATPVRFEMATFGVPVSPDARSAVPVTLPVTLPSTAPLNVVAVITPVAFIPLCPTVTAVPSVETPDTDKLSKNLTLVEVVIKSVEATPVNPPPSPLKVVAVMTPVALSPWELAVTAEPTEMDARVKSSVVDIAVVNPARLDILDIL